MTIDTATTPAPLPLLVLGHGTELHTVARLCATTGRRVELLAPLQSPELVALGNGALLLRGFQSHDGASFLQEWRCVVD